MTTPLPLDPEAKPAPYLLPQEPRAYYRDPRLKSPLAAAALSLMPGLGQVFLGYTRLGFLHAATAASLVALLASNRLGALEPAAGIFLAFFWLYNLVDAHRRALLFNEAITRLESPALPADLNTLSFHGTLAVGVLLMLVGMLSLLSLRFGVSMAWLEDWWPVGVVLFGLYLVVRAIQDRRAQKPETDSDPS